MADLNRSRRRLQAALVVLVGISALALLVLLTPLGGSRAGYAREYDQLRAELHTRLRQRAEVQGIDKKIETARADVARFYEQRLAAQPSAVAERLGQLAGRTRVQIDRAQYFTESTDVADLQRVVVEASLTGDYLAIIRFINALERDRMFFIVDGLSITGQQGGDVSVDISLETFVRMAAS